MNNISTTYAFFSAIDFRGVNTLSSYALPETPLKFISEIPSERKTKFLWNFGDGTISDKKNPIKYWKYPGVYSVNLVIYDCFDNAQLSNFTRQVTIHDYIPFTLNFSGYVGQFDTDLIFETGAISDPLILTTKYPIYQPPSDVFYNVIGSDSSNYFTIKDDKFSHLDEYYTLYRKVWNNSISAFQYDEIDRIKPKTSPIYARIINNTIQNCLSSESGAFFVGLSANTEVFFKDDLPSNRVDISFFFDKSNNHFISDYGNNPQTHLNNLKVTLSSQVVENTNPSYLSITSNGLDGEGVIIDSFDISPIKIHNTKIPFVVKIKDSNQYTVKSFEPLSSVSLNISLTSIDAFNYQIVDIDSTNGGSYRGYVKIDSPTGDVVRDVRIVCNGNFQNLSNTVYSLSGQSASFNVYPKNYYDIYKVNEDFDSLKTLKDLRFQETLLNKNVLFEDFLGSVFGSENSSYDTIGKKTYEKISNFVDNISDVDSCENTSLMSLGEMMMIEDDIIESPENVDRLMNLFSISKHRLLGTSNKFRENFDPKGRASKEFFGKNLGERIDNLTYTISAGVPIVALEKFSNTYTLLNTYQPGLSTYQLSAYNEDWGWPLVLPTSFNPSEFEKFYVFFEYNDVYDNTVKGSVIDFDNPMTNIPSNVTNEELFDEWGIAENMFTSALYDSLDI
jgi:hypothetical protein